MIADITYQEKSIWVSMLATVVVYGRYFASGGRGGLIGTIIVLVMIQIAAQIAIAVLHRPEPKDERDRLIDAKAYRVGYFILVAGVIFCMNIGSRPTVNALLMALVAAEVVKSGTQLIYYRRGA